MENELMSFEEVSRRRTRSRVSAISEYLEGRKNTLAEAAGPLPDQEKIQHLSTKRVLRAKGADGREGKG